MKSLLRSFLLVAALCAAAAAVVSGGVARPFWSFVGGLGLFAADLLLIAWLGARMLGVSGGEPGGKGGSLLLVLGLLAKVMIVGVGVYLALVPLDLQVGYFVAGLCAGLVSLVAGRGGQRGHGFFPFQRIEK